MMNPEVIQTFMEHGWFHAPGVYAVFDGQFGSTGKGLMSAALGEAFASDIDLVTTNAGPNSGHTAYIDSKKVVTHQIPIGAIASGRIAYLNAGAIIDPNILEREIGEHGTTVRIHPNAVVVRESHLGQNTSVSSTGSGVGPAMAAKIGRRVGSIVVARDYDAWEVYSTQPNLDGVVLMEVPQGFSLGINQQFYPYCTVRECTPAQGIADLGVSPKRLRKSIVVLRTYPIRTGSLPDSTSGPCYHDQKELTWEELRLESEIATTTGRVRRIFSWSWQQFGDMLWATEPDALFLNFCNYWSMEMVDNLDYYVGEILAQYTDIIGHEPDFILTGWGPRAEDVKLWQP